MIPKNEQPSSIGFHDAPLPKLPGTEPNQTPDFADINLFSSNPALVAEAETLPDQEKAGLHRLGAQWGSAEFFELGRLANQHPPQLHTHDPRGQRLDFVEFHPAWHRLMHAGMDAGLHNSTWTGGSHLARAIGLYMAYQVEAGHICPLTMTHAAMAAVQVQPDIAAAWRSALARTHYDPSFRPWQEKTAVTLGMGMTERQGGTDVRANATSAIQADGHYEITGHKWFMSAPMCDGFLVLAQAKDGLTCFLLPRFRPDGAINGLHFLRLKNKLGNRSNASSEVEFHAAHGERIGAEGRGVHTIINMVQLTRLDCAVASAGLMRLGLASAAHHARHRSVFQRLLIDQPLMRAVLTDMALEVEAVTAAAMRLAIAFDHAGNYAEEAFHARLLTPAIKYHVCKIAPALLYEAMECHGGNGYVEDLPLARAYREAPVNAIWEGSGNVMALDILRAAASHRDETIALIETLASRCISPVSDVAGELKAIIWSDQAPACGRMIAERLARLAAAAALSERQPDFATDYIRARLHGSASGTIGVIPHLENASALLERANA